MSSPSVTREEWDNADQETYIKEALGHIVFCQKIAELTRQARSKHIVMAAHDSALKVFDLRRVDDLEALRAQKPILDRIWEGSIAQVGEGYGCCEYYGWDGTWMMHDESPIIEAYVAFVEKTQELDRFEERLCAGEPRRLGMEQQSLYLLALFCSISHYTLTASHQPEPLPHP